MTETDFNKFKIARITKACDQCSRFRRKCDGKAPCSLCVEKSRKCSYSKIPKKRGPGYKQDLVSVTISNRPKFVYTRTDFITTKVTDSSGYSASILDMYFSFSHQHCPIFSKIWLIKNINDVPMHVLHVIYMLVLTNAKQAVHNGHTLAKPHLEFVQKEMMDHFENWDPFWIATLVNLTLWGFYTKHRKRQVLYLSMAVKASQILGLDRDVDYTWKSSASGRILGHEVGLDKQFLRGLWFLCYQWDHHNILVYQDAMMIDTSIPESVITSFVSPNTGDSSNIPSK